MKIDRRLIILFGVLLAILLWYNDKKTNPSDSGSSLSTVINPDDGKLTREKAAELLGKKFPRTVFNVFKYGTHKELCSRDWPEYYLPSWNKKLKDAGLTIVEELGNDGSGGVLNYCLYRISVPEEMKKYIAEVYKDPDERGDNEEMCLIKLGEQTLLEITGIREIESGHSAEVEYSFRFSNSTPFAKLIDRYIIFSYNSRSQSSVTVYPYNDQKVGVGKVKMEKFDDGWRLADRFEYPVM